MEMLSHLFHALGGALIWIASVLALEELTFGGLALLLMSVATRTHGKNGIQQKGSASKPGSAVKSTARQGGASCSQSNIY